MGQKVSFILATCCPLTFKFQSNTQQQSCFVFTFFFKSNLRISVQWCGPIQIKWSEWNEVMPFGTLSKHYPINTNSHVLPRPGFSLLVSTGESKYSLRLSISSLFLKAKIRPGNVNTFIYTTYLLWFTEYLWYNNGSHFTKQIGQDLGSGLDMTRFWQIWDILNRLECYLSLCSGIKWP